MPNTNLPPTSQNAAEEDRLKRLYTSLHRIASAHMRNERANHTLQTTALVNEAYLRLSESDRVPWDDKTRFLAAASRVMREVLINHANRKNAAKRGGNAQRFLLSDIPDVQPDPVDVLQFNEALTKLSEQSERQARIVEMRFFAGMSIPEVAQVLGVSSTTVENDWYAARARLSRMLSETR